MQETDSDLHRQISRLQEECSSLSVIENPLPSLYEKRAKLQQQKESLERSVITSPSYLGLVVEQFHWKDGIDDYVPCLIQLLKPFMSIHLCDTYETSKELLLRYKPIRIWVMERLVQTKPPLPTLHEGDITLIHPSTLLADHSTPISIINAVCSNTYFLKEGEPKSLSSLIGKYHIRVITSDGSIHSVPFSLFCDL